MFIATSVFGLLIAVIGLWGFIWPKNFMELIQRFIRISTGIYWIFGFRLVLGSLLLVAAPFSYYPTLFYVLGVLSLFGAMMTILLGNDNIEHYMAWWLKRPLVCLRVVMLVAWLIGVLLIYVSYLSL